MALPRTTTAWVVVRRSSYVFTVIHDSSGAGILLSQLGRKRHLLFLHDPSREAIDISLALPCSIKGVC